MVIVTEATKTSCGYVQPGEMIEAKIDRTDNVSGSRYRSWSKRIYRGLTTTGKIVIEHPGTHVVTFLMLNRIRKI